MQKIIEIKNLSFGYNEKLIFENFNLEIDEGTFTTIIGPAKSGKSTLGKLIAGALKSQMVHVKNKPFLIYYDSKNIVVDEILSHFENSSKEKVIEISKMLGLEYLIDKKMDELTIDQKQLISLIEAFILKPNIIIFDSTQGQINSFYKSKILNELIKLKSTIIHITNDVEDVLIGNEIIVLDNGKLVFQDKTENIFNTDIFEKLVIGKPFVFELSERLQFYGLCQKSHYKEDELVENIWK